MKRQIFITHKKMNTHHEKDTDVSDLEATLWFIAMAACLLAWFTV